MASRKKPETPPKGILKNRLSSYLMKENAAERRPSRDMKWDEANIRATFHPPGKTYGHQKVEEPPTPYYYERELEKKGYLDPKDLASRLKDVKASQDDKSRKTSFDSKRRAHYNEYQAVKLARHLIEEEDEKSQGTRGPKKK